MSPNKFEGLTKDEIEVLSLVFRCSTFNFLCRQDKTSDQIRIFEDLQTQVESLQREQAND